MSIKLTLDWWYNFDNDGSTNLIRPLEGAAKGVKGIVTTYLLKE